MVATVLLVEDHPAVMRGLVTMCDGDESVEVVGHGDAAGALAMAQRLHPQVVVLPLRLPDAERGVALCRSLRAACDARLVLFTHFRVQPVDVALAQLVAASAIFSRAVSIGEFWQALHPNSVNACSDALISAGGLRGRNRRGTPLVLATLDERLTAVERSVLDLALDDLSNSQIADVLNLPVSTVMACIAAIVRRLERPDQLQVRSEATSTPRETPAAGTELSVEAVSMRLTDSPHWAITATTTTAVGNLPLGIDRLFGVRVQDNLWLPGGDTESAAESFERKLSKEAPAPKRVANRVVGGVDCFVLEGCNDERHYYVVGAVVGGRPFLLQFRVPAGLPDGEQMIEQMLATVDIKGALAL